MKILYLHGWQSTPGGVKPTYLKSHGHEVLNPALPDDDFAAAVAIAQAEFDEHQPDVVVRKLKGWCRRHEHRRGRHAARFALPSMEAMGSGDEETNEPPISNGSRSPRQSDILKVSIELIIHVSPIYPQIGYCSAKFSG